MGNAFKTLVDTSQEYQEFLILLPDKPDLDEVASALSLYLSLLESKKNAKVVCTSPMIADFSRLIGVDAVTSNFGDKNLQIRFINYEASNVDKVSYDIENGQFKLVVSPKTGFKSPTKDQIKIDYSGTSADFVILVGGESEESFKLLKNLERAKTKIMHVGHNFLRISDQELQVLSFAKQASSTSEVVAGLLKEGDFVIDADIATNLLAGIEKGSDNFQDENVTSQTFELFADLLRSGGVRIKRLKPGIFPQGAIPNRPYSNQTPQEFPEQTIKDRQMTPEEAEKELDQEIPPSWSEPKIYTGTSIS